MKLSDSKIRISFTFLLSGLLHVLIVLIMPSSDLNRAVSEKKVVKIKLIERKKEKAKVPKEIKAKKETVKKDKKKEPPKKAKKLTKKRAKAKTKKLNTKKSEPLKTKKKIIPKAFSVDLEATIDMGGVAVTALEGGGNIIADGTDLKSEVGKKEDNKVPDPVPTEEIEYVNTMPSLLFKPSEEDLKKYYPDEARSQGLESDVKLEILISNNGKVLKVKVINKSEAAFQKAAKNLIKRFRFKPAIKNNKKVAVWINWTYKFRLGS